MLRQEAMSASALPVDRTITLVGLMGVGKSTVGRRLAKALGLPFCDVDDEIVKAAGMSIPEIFAKHGEAEFRAGERRVIARLLSGTPHILATGGGAFIDPETRALMKEKALSVWLKADLELLARRVGRRGDRPLVKDKDPMDVLKVQAEQRYPFYGEADVVVATGDRSLASTTEQVIDALTEYLRGRA
jgi:shikimate kinase